MWIPDDHMPEYLLNNHEEGSGGVKASAIYFLKAVGWCTAGGLVLGLAQYYLETGRIQDNRALANPFSLFAIDAFRRLRAEKVGLEEDFTGAGKYISRF